DHSSPHVLLHPARGDVDHADWRLDEVQLRDLAELVGELRASDDRVEKRRVDGVHGVLQNLEPVARIEIFLPGDDPVAWSLEAIVDGKRRLLVRRPHVRKDDPTVFVRRIRAVAESVLERALGWLAWSLENGAVDVEEPAVVTASDASLRDQPVLERRPSMGTVQLEQPHTPTPVPEGYELLGEDRHAQGHVAQIVGEADRLPEAPEVFAARCSRTDVRQLRVFGGYFAVIVGAEASGQERRSGRHGGSPYPRGPLGIQPRRRNVAASVVPGRSRDQAERRAMSLPRCSASSGSRCPRAEAAGGGAP